MLNHQVITQALLLVGLSGAITACGHRMVSVATVYSSNQCSMVEPSVRSIDTPEQLDALRKTLKRKFSETQPLEQPIDLQNQTLILYALGQKSTGGYSINLLKDEAALKGQTLYLPLQLQEPRADTFQTQGITSPCQVYVIPKTEITRIERVQNSGIK